MLSLPALFAAPPPASALRARTATLPRCNTTRPRHALAMRASEAPADGTPTLPRRTFSSLLAALPLSALASPAVAADVSGLVTPYRDLPKGFSILRPSGWNEFEGMQDSYDIKWQDVIQPLEFVTVLTTPLPKDKDLGDIGPADAVGKKLAGGRDGELVNSSQKDIDGVPAYVFEIKRGSSHQITLLAVNKQKLYSVNASCSERRWPRREKLLRSVVDSFKPKL